MHARTTLPPPLVDLARWQGDLFCTADAEAVGVSQTALRRNRCGAWGRHATSIWSLSDRTTFGTDKAAEALHDARRRAFGIQLSHPTAAATDVLAAELRGWDGWWDGTADRHTAPPTAFRRRGWRARVLPPDAVELVDGLRVTSVRQTLCDLAEVLDANGLELCVESAARLGDLPDELFGPPALRAVLQRRAGRPPTESMAETLFLQLARQIEGLREPDRQVEVRSASGTFLGRVDFVWPERNLCIEVKGRFHDEKGSQDDARATAITVARGWIVISLRWEHLVNTPFETLRRLRRLVAA